MYGICPLNITPRKMPKLIPILSCSYFHVLMLRRDQTHPQQEIMLEFLPIYYFTPFPQKY